MKKEDPHFRSETSCTFQDVTRIKFWVEVEKSIAQIKRQKTSSYTTKNFLEEKNGVLGGNTQLVSQRSNVFDVIAGQSS